MNTTFTFIRAVVSPEIKKQIKMSAVELDMSESELIRVSVLKYIEDRLNKRIKLND